MKKIPIGWLRPYLQFPGRTRMTASAGASVKTLAKTSTALAREDRPDKTAHERRSNVRERFRHLHFFNLQPILEFSYSLAALLTASRNICLRLPNAAADDSIEPLTAMEDLRRPSAVGRIRPVKPHDFSHGKVGWAVPSRTLKPENTRVERPVGQVRSCRKVETPITA